MLKYLMDSVCHKSLKKEKTLICDLLKIIIFLINFLFFKNGISS